jgi:hypothetical protein
MKAAPRNAEREIARILSEFFVSLGMSSVERIPVLGRTGPDITINEFGLVVDVKNRLEVPKGYFHDGLTSFGELLGFPISEMNSVKGEPAEEWPASKTVTAWFWHMDEWRVKYCKQGITALVLHRPNQRMPFGKSMVIISKLQKEYFAQCLPSQTTA